MEPISTLAFDGEAYFVNSARGGTEGRTLKEKKKEKTLIDKEKKGELLR